MFDLESDRRKVDLPRPAEKDAGREAAGRGAGGRASASHLDAASVMHLQRLAGNAGVVQMLQDEADAGAQEQDSSPVHDVVGRGSGSPLDESVRAPMESSFGQDFSDVRVHTDGQASKSAESVGANAYTVGNDIVFRSGHFDAASPTGQRTIAHELSHVVQQRSGPVDPGDKFERAADATADQVVSGASAPAAASAGGGTAVQLEEAEDEAEAPVQREAAGPQDEEEEQQGGMSG